MPNSWIKVTVIGRRRQRQPPAAANRNNGEDGVLRSFSHQIVGSVDHSQNGAKSCGIAASGADDDIAASRLKLLQDLRRPDADRAERVGRAKVGQRVYIPAPPGYSPPRRLRCCVDGLADRPSGWTSVRRSLSIISCRHFLSSAVSHLAFDGESSSQNQTITRQQHRRQPSSREQPLPALQVHRPSIDKMQPGNNRPTIAVVTSIAIINSALARAREKGQEPVGQIGRIPGENRPR